MKEVFQNADSALVGLYQSILENAGISTFVHNVGPQQLIVDVVPTLSVLNDVDYDQAISILGDLRDTEVSGKSEWNCPACGEKVPGNFTSCWKCQTERNAKVI
jgi:hypothetical protein